MSDSTAFALIAGRYQLEQRIGAGGSGEVWRATDTLLNRLVAVKIMRPELVGQEVARRRFQAEARHAGSLVHVAIAKLYDYDEAGPEQRPFLVMEYVHGQSLAEELSGRPVSPARAMDLVAQIAAGLHAAHSAGLGHGDIKPHNVLLDFDGRVKLTDFGVTFGPAASETTEPEALLGTPEYRAPERMTGARASPASDLYSLGILAYQCLTGRVPFRGRVAEVAEAHRGWPLPPLPAGVPVPIAQLIDDLTAKEPADRPADADEVAHRAAALRDELALETPAGITALPDGSTAGPGGEAAPVSPSAAGGRGQGPLRRQRGRVYLALASVVAIAAAAWTAASVLISPAGHSGGNAPRARLVDVNAAALRGQPVTVVTLRLRDEGLIVTVQWRPDSGLPTGLVISVRPAGRLSAGTRVLVTGSAAPGTTPQPGPARSAARPPGPPVRPAPPRPHPSQPGDPPVLTSGPAPSIPLPSASATSPTPSVSPTPTATPTPSPDPSGSTGTDRAQASSSQAGHNSGSARANKPPNHNLCDVSGPDWVLISLAASLPPGAAGCPPFPPAADQR